MPKQATKGLSHSADRSKDHGPRFSIPFTRKNYIAFAAGLVILLIGFLCLKQPPVNGFLSLTVAPILLVLGYCVVFPYAIITRDKPRQEAAPQIKGD
jgi:hypothetical protein